jgi:hypothetical protein
LENWAWGLSLIALTVVIHATGVVFMALAGVRLRVRIERHQSSYALVITIGLVGVMGLLLAALHGVEAVVWAVAYWCVGALDSLPDAILYSLDTISTRGASGVMLEQPWRTMGALEAMDGMLLFGISTAYLFAVMQIQWSLITDGHR